MDVGTKFKNDESTNSNTYHRHRSTHATLPQPRSFFGLNVFLTIVTQLIPLMYFVILYRARHLLHPPSKRSAHSQLRDRQRREQGHELKPISFLFEHYDTLIASKMRDHMMAVLPKAGQVRSLSAACTAARAQANAYDSEWLTRCFR